MSIKFSHDKKRFEIKCEQSRSGLLCVGYVDGARSVTGPSAHIAARVLIKKHVARQPEAKVLPFPRSDWQDDALSPEEELGLAGSEPTGSDSGLRS